MWRSSLLCVARLDSVALDVSLPVNLRQLAEEVVGSMAHLALSAHRSTALTGADHPVVVTGNAAAIKDALRNLIENALLHTPPGTEVVIEVDTKGAISVQDSGPGVSAEDRQRVFERFWRGKGVRTDGAGLGLAIVMEIVRAHARQCSGKRPLPARASTSASELPEEAISRLGSPMSQNGNRGRCVASMLSKRFAAPRVGQCRAPAQPCSRNGYRRRTRSGQADEVQRPSKRRRARRTGRRDLRALLQLAR